MTNQEVAKSLKNIRDLYPWGEDSYKTLDYAIRAVIELPKRRKESKRWRAKAHQIAGESYENGYLAGQKNVAERCEDAISRQAVIDACEQSINILEAVDRIMDLPSVNPQESKIGHWISHREHCENLGVIPSGLGFYEWCSNCECGIDVNEWHRNHYNYCPNCGAKMVEEQESEG